VSAAPAGDPVGMAAGVLEFNLGRADADSAVPFFLGLWMSPLCGLIHRPRGWPVACAPSLCGDAKP
jgi:hypothetical protein